jgi:ATP-dependent Lon protease
MIADIDGDLKDFLNVNTPEQVPVLALRNMVLFPGVVTPILIGRKISKTLVEKAERKGLIIGVVSQRDPEVDEPGIDDLYSVGVYAKVMKILTLPNGNITAIVQGLGRMELDELTSTSPYLEGKVTPLEEVQPEEKDREFKTAAADLRDLVNQYISVTEEIPDEASFAIKNISNPVMVLNFVCTNMPFNHKDKQKMLEAETVKERLFMTMKLLNREINLQNLKAEIRNKTREDIDEQQRNYFLQQQIKNMQAEMGNGESFEKSELIRKSMRKNWSYEMSRLFRKECDKLDNLNPQSPEYNVQLTYLQNLEN